MKTPIAIRRQRAAIYRRAAEFIHTGRSHFACVALIPASFSAEAADSHLPLFKRFQPKDLYGMAPWFGKTHIRRNQERRILALLLCAAMAESGEWDEGD